MATLLGITLYGPNLWEDSTQEKFLAAPVAARPIQMPSSDSGDDIDEDNTAIANRTGFGVQRGQIGVQWSSDKASNITSKAGGNATEDGDAKLRADRGRRGRGRRSGVGGDISDMR